jgi:hypothetical protein
VKSYLVVLVSFLSCFASLAVEALDAPKSERERPVALSPAEAESQGRALVADLLALRPQPVTNSGVLRIRGADRRVREFELRFQVFDGPSGVVAIYEVTGASGKPGGAKLTITHPPGAASTYSLEENSNSPGAGPTPRQLAGTETMIPFAGSDFWVADLGLEFLHWPKPLLLRKEMRRSRPCNVLETRNPQTAAGYSRVVSWIDIESSGILHADAFDSAGKLLKQFDPTELQKVGSERQVREIEMRNCQTGSQSSIEFHLGDVK